MAFPGLTSISLTKDRIKARDSVSALVLRYSLMSFAKAVIVSTLSSVTLRFERIALASSAAVSSFSLRSRCSLMRSEASAMSMSVVSTKCQMRPSFRFTSSSSSSMVSSRLRCSLAAPSICSFTTFTRARILPSVRTLERILSTTSSLKRRALSLGVSQASLPRFMIDWQT